MRKFIAIYILVLLPLFFYAQDPASLFNKGNIYYQQKDYAKAIQFYDSIIKCGYESAGAYYNLGNAYYRLQKYPLAILNYERAKKLGGNRNDVNFNLTLANLNITDKIEALPDLLIFRLKEDMLNSKSSKGWGLLAIISLWAGLILWILFTFSKNISLKKITSVLLILSMIVFLFLGYLTWSRYRNEKIHNYAIIFTPAVYVKSAPDNTSTDLFIIHEGVKVRLMENFGDWYEIRLADGKTGWVTKESFEAI
jgi:tetratricopeptide (TPR) repeat protein